MNVNFFSDLNITVSTQIPPQASLKQETKIDGEAMKYIPEKLLGHEIFSSIVPWATNFF